MITNPEPSPLKMMERPSVEHLREELTPEQFTRLNDLIDEYDSLFMKHQYDFGFTNLVQHRIHLMPNAKPHKDTLRRLTPEKRQQADETIKELIEGGNIIESNSPWGAAIVLVKKRVLTTCGCA